jgi:uncharacterized protein YjdB
MKKIGALIGSTLILCLGLSGCGGGSSKSKSQSSENTKTLVSISVTSTNSATSVAIGATLHLAAQGKFSDGTVEDITPQVAWKSSDTTMAIVNSAGVLTGAKAGSVTVSASESTISGSIGIVVTQVALSSIAIGGNVSLTAGASEQLSAQGAYSDSSTQSITSQVTWKSLDTTIATVSSSGMLTSLKAGTVSITASMGSVTGNASVTVTSVSLTTINVGAPSPSLAAGGSEQLTATGMYSDNSTQSLTGQVIWSISDPTVASISGTGFLTALKAGSVTVMATLGSVSGTGNVAVTTPSLSSVAITPALFSIASGQTRQLSAVGAYSDGSSQDVTGKVTWKSLDTTIATVGSSGMLTSLKAGTVSITASMGSVTGSASVTVTSASLTTINVGAPSPSLATGGTEQLTATGVYSDNSTQSLTNQVIWSTSDPTVASVSGTGFLTALKAGSVTVTATSGSVSGTGNVAVTASSLSSITITPAVFSIASGQTKQLSAVGVYSDGNSRDVTSQVTWNSLGTGYATVSSTGLVTGVSAGNSTITASIGSTTGSAVATVTAALLRSIVVSPATASIATGQTQAFTANGIFSDGSSTDMTDSVVWGSNAARFASVDATGLATGVGAGTATITAASGTTSGSAILTVTTAVLSEVDISPDAETIPIGGQVQLTLTGTYSDGTTQTLTNVTWSSSDPSFASVDPVSGNVTGVADSNGYPVTITATSNGMSDTTTVFVTPAVMESLEITPATDSIASGTSVQYSVVANYSDGSMQPLTAGLSWSSAPASIAGVDSNGMATGVAPGQATITVSYASLTGSAVLTVTPATLSSIVVTPVLDKVGVNGNVQFTATGVFTDSSTQDLTAQVSWTSSAANIALINNTGLATGLSLGATTVTATYGGLNGSTTLTVATSTLVSITIAPPNPILPPRARLQMTAYGNFSDGSQIPLSGVQWRTYGGKSHSRFGGYYATISHSGLLRTKRSSTQPIQITASLSGLTGTTSLTITTMTVKSLRLTPANPTMAVGTTLPFKLIGTFSDGVTTVDLSNSARWQTSNWRNALINNSGVVFGRSSGSATISGSYGGLTPATTTLTISNATLESITIDPASPTILLGALQPFTALGLFSDGSTQDITTISRWTSSTPAVAVINRNGVAWSASHGQTDINATFSGVTGATPLNVN